MARYTSVLDRTFNITSRDRALVVEVNGGSLTIEAHDEVAFVLVDTISVDTATRLFNRGMRLRLTPVGGATFFIDEDG